jgi:drug/metabolite transporter (DMT)-like permease
VALSKRHFFTYDLIQHHQSLVAGADHLQAVGVVTHTADACAGERSVLCSLHGADPIEKVGVPVAASINNLSPFIATGLAIVLLGERVTLPILPGTLVIVLGTILLSRSGKHIGFRFWHLLYPLLSASCFGIGGGVAENTGIFLGGERLSGRIVVGTVFVVLGVFLLTGATHLLAGG